MALVLIAFGEYAFHRLEIAIAEKYAGMRRKAAGRLVTNLPASEEKRQTTKVFEGCLQAT